ncbi:MAG TPA: putative toxin-antitoxin system toxin component, PIN family [Chitinophagales bacterium]|nr:putative toxin-antitoxin system toxin component, PIN family [Chitinophagales bacterium]
MELFETLTDPSISKYLDQDFVLDFLLNYSAAVTNIKVVTQVTACRDVKDNFLLALSKDAGVKYLITRDKDLLVMKQFESTLIITLPEFLKTLHAHAE